MTEENKINEAEACENEGAESEATCEKGSKSDKKLKKEMLNQNILMPKQSTLE